MNVVDPVLGADVDEVVAARSAGSLRAYWLSMPPLTVSSSAPLGDHPGHHVCFGRVGGDEVRVFGQQPATGAQGGDDRGDGGPAAPARRRDGLGGDQVSQRGARYLAAMRR